MEIEVRHERKRLLAQIDKLEIGRCERCANTPSDQKMVHCDCLSAVEIRKCGEALIKTVTRNRDKEIDKVIAGIKKNGLTVDSYRQIKEFGLSDAQLIERIGWYKVKLTDFKYDNGMTKYKGPDQTEIPEWAQQKADNNGIPLSLVRKRVKVHGWTMERASTEASSSMRKGYQKWLKVAEQNGIKKKTFNRRLERGIDMQVAATAQRMEKRKKKVVKV